jgi:hypothetical protein
VRLSLGRRHRRSGAQHALEWKRSSGGREEAERPGPSLVLRTGAPQASRAKVARWLGVAWSPMRRKASHARGSKAFGWHRRHGRLGGREAEQKLGGRPAVPGSEPLGCTTGTGGLVVGRLGRSEAEGQPSQSVKTFGVRSRRGRRSGRGGMVAGTARRKRRSGREWERAQAFRGGVGRERQNLWAA